MIVRYGKDANHRASFKIDDMVREPRKRDAANG
jgi:hypothetical protein